mmetsp:Transcript_34630/g.76136  ORF Transcript_34630/g.76136 Transcript_34630/m.76136 type:complete len:206 (-) Transcript_34630:206-823(-)
MRPRRIRAWAPTRRRARAWTARRRPPTPPTCCASASGSACAAPVCSCRLSTRTTAATSSSPCQSQRRSITSGQTARQRAMRGWRRFAKRSTTSTSRHRRRCPPSRLPLPPTRRLAPPWQPCCARMRVMLSWCAAARTPLPPPATPAHSVHSSPGSRNRPRRAASSARRRYMLPFWPHGKSPSRCCSRRTRRWRRMRCWRLRTTMG